MTQNFFDTKPVWVLCYANSFPHCSFKGEIYVYIQTDINLWSILGKKEGNLYPLLFIQKFFYNWILKQCSPNFFWSRHGYPLASSECHKCVHKACLGLLKSQLSQRKGLSWLSRYTSWPYTGQNLFALCNVGILAGWHIPYMGLSRFAPAI